MKRLDVPTMVTGVIVIGFAAIFAWAALGQGFVIPMRTLFAGVLLVAGSLGLMIILGRSPGNRKTNERKK
nr:hypothetical protein [Arachnia propionica]